MYHFLFAFRYLTLRNKNGVLVVWRDVLPVLIISALLSAPFIFMKGSIFFGSGGFVDKAANLTVGLTGFYVAGLLAVATFAASSSSLDNPIKVGPVFWSKAGVRANEALSRREYVCSIFGYLAFISLIISVVSGVITGVAPAIKLIVHNYVLHLGSWRFDCESLISVVAKATYTTVISHLLVSSGYGLYYLIFKIYAKEPKLHKPQERAGPRIS